MEHPIISCTQKIVIYETKARFYVVGSNNLETRFRVLKIDRTEPRELQITDDKVEYTQKEIKNLLLMIDVGNRPKLLQKSGFGLSRTVSAFGIVGFIRFLEGYYIVLITKRRRVAQIGCHTIYKIEDTSMVYIPNDTVKYTHPDEQRYVKMFQNVDLSSNFYFSYSYDLTHTLQYNLTPSKPLEQEPASQEESGQKSSHFWTTEEVQDAGIFSTHHSEDDVEDAKTSLESFLESDSMQNGSGSGNGKDPTDSQSSQGRQNKKGGETADECYGIRNPPSHHYAWNQHMLKKVEDELHCDWVLYIIHGFIAQSNVNIFGHPVFLTLIARRSKEFAGTRFLKRGANCDGYVANEVETEQIVNDATVTSFKFGRFTSFVQLRGSIPLFWSQDVAKMVPKPAINLDQSDPYGHIAGQHFSQMLARYGAPVIILNLVKKREKKRHESILSEEFVNVIKYLNQFLPPEHSIQYIGFDMARVSKMRVSNVLGRLAMIAEYCMKRTGFFQSSPGLHCNQLRPHIRCQGLKSNTAVMGEKRGEPVIGQKQLGVVRTNCVDCLDRTNTAQFAIGKCALAFQLYSLGMIDSPILEFDTDCVRMLEELYEDQGDTLALQYGGSHLVHRIKGYRNIAPWTSSSRDIMQTLSRYYSNAFSDAEKQHAINVFLGVFEPQEGQPNIWELPTDVYMHNRQCSFGPQPRQRSYSQWWDPPVFACLPKPYEEEFKGSHRRQIVIKTLADDERISGFWDYYKPYELTSLDDLFSFHMANGIRDFMPKFATNYSPFAVRVRPGRRQEESGNSITEANPNVSGKDSTSSTTSAGSSEGSTSSSEGSDIDGDIDIMVGNNAHREDSGLSLVSLKDLFPTMGQTYGVEIKEPEKHSVAGYKWYVQLGRNAYCPIDSDKDMTKTRKGTELIQISTFSLDSSYHVIPPKVNQKSNHIYERYVRCGKQGASQPSKQNMKVYQDYLSHKYT